MLRSQSFQSYSAFIASLKYLHLRFVQDSPLPLYDRPSGIVVNLAGEEVGIASYEIDAANHCNFKAHVFSTHIEYIEWVHTVAQSVVRSSVAKSLQYL